MGNIFEFLGLPADHRVGTKVSQNVKHFDDVNDKHKDKDFLYQLKADGNCSFTVVHQGRVGIFSRVGNKFTNCEHLESAAGRNLADDGVYIGEITCKGISLEILSGIISPNRKAPVEQDLIWVADEMGIEMFDYITIDEFIQGESFETFVSRFVTLTILVDTTGWYFSTIPMLNDTESGKGRDDYFDEAVAAGEEGIIIRDPHAGWVAGHKGWRVMKKVRYIDYDLLCIGYKEGKGKHKGIISDLFFKWKDGREVKCSMGKGWDYPRLATMFQSAEGGGYTPVGKVFHVYAMQESSKGVMRNPKFGELRHDKVEADVV